MRSRPGPVMAASPKGWSVRASAPVRCRRSTGWCKLLRGSLRSSTQLLAALGIGRVRVSDAAWRRPWRASTVVVAFLAGHGCLTPLLVSFQHDDEYQRPTNGGAGERSCGAGERDQD